MIDRRHIGHALPAFTVPVEAGRLRFFAKATGQADALMSKCGSATLLIPLGGGHGLPGPGAPCTDEGAARDAGHPGLPVPPTFLFCLEMDSPDPAAMRKLLGIDYRRILHGEQHFSYHAAVHAGDLLRFEPRIADISDKKNGALEFVRRETRVINQHGVLVAELSCVTVVRNTAPGPSVQQAAASAPEAANDAASQAAVAAPSNPRYDDLQLGDALPPLRVEPISRLALALYCGASGDHNPVHVDIDFAREAGFNDVFVHGMLPLAYLARQLTGWVPQQQLKRLQARFISITHVGDRLSCHATVTEKLPDNLVRLALEVRDQHGSRKISGEALLELQ